MYRTCTVTHTPQNDSSKIVTICTIIVLIIYCINYINLYIKLVILIIYYINNIYSYYYLQQCQIWLYCLHCIYLSLFPTWSRHVIHHPSQQPSLLWLLDILPIQVRRHAVCIKYCIYHMSIYNGWNNEYVHH